MLPENRNKVQLRALLFRNPETFTDSRPQAIENQPDALTFLDTVCRELQGGKDVYVTIETPKEIERLNLVLPDN